MLPSVKTFFKIEKDPFSIMGQQKDRAMKNRQFVTNLVVKFDLSDEQIADIVNVPIAFVQEVRNSLKK